MRLCYNTDSLGYMPFTEMLDTVCALGFESVEIATGNWSKAPHIDIDELLADKGKRDSYMKEITGRGLVLEALNCSGNQLDPDAGKQHQQVVEKTFQLAELWGIKTIIMMSGLPGGSPTDTTANWITTSWPSSVVKILQWQWDEVLIPYWKKFVQFAKQHGVEKIALENHGSQMVYNPETLIRLRDAVGDPIIGMNLDPSHLFWMGGDPITAAQLLGVERIHYVHAKDIRFERAYYPANGALDTKTIEMYASRAWNYVALGHGHDTMWWKEFFSVVSMLGYDGPVSLEMEDLTMDALTGVKKSLDVLQEALPRTF